MARKRMIDPQMFRSSTVSAWPPATRWTWAGLFCYLDNYGYGEDSPALVKADVWPKDEQWPYTIEQVAGDLDVFAADGSMCRFVCCDKPTIHVPKWFEWQTVAHPGKPRFCVCPAHSRSSHEEHVKVSRRLHETFRLKEFNTSIKVNGGEPSDLTPTGSDGLTEARTVVRSLGQRKPADPLPPSEPACASGE